MQQRDFPRGPVVRTRHFQCWGLGSIPGPGILMGQLETYQVLALGNNLELKSDI